MAQANPAHAAATRYEVARAAAGCERSECGRRHPCGAIRFNPTSAGGLANLDYVELAPG